MEKMVKTYKATFLLMVLFDRYCVLLYTVVVCNVLPVMSFVWCCMLLSSALQCYFLVYYTVCCSVSLFSMLFCVPRTASLQADCTKLQSVA